MYQFFSSSKNLLFSPTPTPTRLLLVLFLYIINVSLCVARPIHHPKCSSYHRIMFVKSHLTINTQTLGSACCCKDHNKRSANFKNLTPDIGGISGGQGGYATNFGGGLSGGAESQVIAAVFKTMVTRFCESFKELKSQENIALYCDIRQLVTYVKGAHGGPFRLVALSGIMAVTPRPNKKLPNMQTTRVIRHIQQHAECPPPPINYQPEETRSQRKLFFKKRSTSSTCAVSIN